MKMSSIVWARNIAVVCLVVGTVNAARAMESPSESKGLGAGAPEVAGSLLLGETDATVFVQDETSFEPTLSTTSEAEWLGYVEMHEQLSGTSARSIFMPWFSLQHRAN